jgi:hypothetical protein
LLFKIYSETLFNLAFSETILEIINFKMTTFYPEDLREISSDKSSDNLIELHQFH